MRDSLRRGAGLCLLLLCLCLLLPAGLAAPAETGLEVRFLDVGEGDAALVTCGGKSMLIDGGPAEASQLVYSVLRDAGVSRLDLMVCTHPHLDHIGGLAAAANACRVGTFLCPLGPDDPRAPESRSFRAVLKKCPLTVPKTGDVYPLGGARVTVLYADASAPDLNDCSLILRVDYGGTSFLFMGDAEAGEERALLASGAELRADVLKAAHHGSGTSTGEAFLRRVRPRYAVISAGAGNDYGHPSDRVLARLGRIGAEVFRTDTMGMLLCRSDGASVTFSREGVRLRRSLPPKLLLLLYLIVINALGFAAGLMERGLRVPSKRVSRLQAALSLLGGAPGTAVSVLCFPKNRRESAETRLTNHIFLMCLTVIYTLIVLYLSGLHRRGFSWALLAVFRGRRLLQAALAALNLLTLLLFCGVLRVKGTSAEGRHLRLTLAFLGGAAGAWIGAKLAGDKRPWVTKGLPMILLTHAAVLLFLANV